MKQIYVHGLGQTSDSWTKTIDILQTTDYSLCPNLPDLVHSKEVTYDNLYAAFSDYCNQYDEPIDLCGLSLGGVLALNYAIQYPKKVRSLVLIATQYKMPKKLLKFQNLLFRFMPKSMFQQMGFRKADFFLLCETMMELDFNNSLHKISCPTLLLYGEKDTANYPYRRWSDRLPELTGGGYDECQKQKMYSKAQLKISLCEPSPQSDRHFCHCADNAAIYVHVHHCLVVERQL